jgi:citronellol/citronellal dehydrogenase
MGGNASMSSLKEKVIFITGASRGIGKAIALKAAADGAHIVIASKTHSPHPKLQGTIYETAQEVVAAGGKALPLIMDIRDETQILTAVEKTVAEFGGIDILVNNASAIFPSDTLSLPIKRFDLMQQINARGTFLCSQACLPHLLKAQNPHILTMSPPLNMNAEWFKAYLGYTLSKYGMSMCTVGLAAEFASQGVAVNSLWPRTLIATAALSLIFSEQGIYQEMIKKTRKPSIVADAAYHILTRDSKSTTGQFFIDEEVLRDVGITDLSSYATVPGNELQGDLFL